MLGDTFPTAAGHRARAEEDVPAVVTDIGCERDINEDRFIALDSISGRAWIVCDGMGGTLGGELAAQLAIDAVRRSLESGDFASGEEALTSSIQEANRIIVLRRQNPAFSGMGTTVVGVIVAGGEVTITHAGDSRAYLVRAGGIQQLTTDHTYVQDLVDRGIITHEEALSHPQSHVLTRCLGAEPRLYLEAQNLWLWETPPGESNDRLVLCTDGLYSLVSDDEIAAIASSCAPQEACVQLIELAKSRGGFDNITVAVIPVDGQLREEDPGTGFKITNRRRDTGRVRPARNGGGLGSNLHEMPTGKKVMLLGAVLTLSMSIAFALGLILLGRGGDTVVTTAAEQPAAEPAK